MAVLLKALREGSSLRSACSTAGVSQTGIRQRIDRDAGFRERVQAARGLATGVVEQSVFKAATTTDNHGRYDVKAQELWLTNQAPEDWHRRHEDARSSDTDREVLNRAREMNADEKAAGRRDAHAEILGGDEAHTKNEKTVH